ncbi:DMT family transporter [Lacticaseibacillus pantheris]|uniref:DMT family transporter n=1 Tax=Lacticaseibacillus pantheris TaxID=171523 RepID=UPI002659D802|nr:EamA family transporter [Lacticaseibacillus pantheris]WKF85272.1 EamA family transporter [Lacticaseibacillus pantheris]
MKKSTNGGIALRAAIGTTMWGVGGVLSNIIFNTSHATPAWLVSMRLTWAGLAMLAYGLITHQPLLRVWRNRADALRLIAFGIVGVAMAQFSYLLAIFYGNAAIATIMLSLVPAMITVVVCISDRMWPRPIDTIAITIALIGVFFLVTDGNVTQLHVAPLAVLWGLVAAVTGAAYTLLPRPLLQHEPPLVIVAWGLVIGGFLMNWITPVWRVPTGLHAWSWLFIAFIIFGATFLAYILYVSSLKTLRPAIASMIGNLEPLTATILSIIFLALGFHFLQFTGIVLVLAAVCMMSWVPKKQRV